MAETFPYPYKVEVDKAPRARAPKQVAVIDQTGCTGCEACLAFCPVDCIEIVAGPEHPDFMKLVEVDLERCIGCQLCARYCPWETIDMWSYEEGVEAAPTLTIRSLLYNYDPEQMHESAESRG
jgi:formate hydrogenlyase subunit 6/NADH:ubiquinone oxidoreductase subunit I